VELAGGVQVLADHLGAFVDALGLGLHRSGDVDPGEPAPLQQEAVWFAVGGLELGGGSLEVAGAVTAAVVQAALHPRHAG
jgi:hypothetical protein